MECEDDLLKVDSNLSSGLLLLKKTSLYMTFCELSFIPLDKSEKDILSVPCSTKKSCASAMFSVFSGNSLLWNQGKGLLLLLYHISQIKELNYNDIRTFTYMFKYRDLTRAFVYVFF